MKIGEFQKKYFREAVVVLGVKPEQDIDLLL
jgi:hypothetical protein